jgi:hypothetical protein
MNAAAIVPRSFGELRASTGTLRAWPLRRWVAASLVAALAAMVMGVPTGIVQTSYYTRMTPVTWWDYPVWAISALLIGLVAATYVRIPGRETPVPDRSGRTVGATLLSTFAVGCPICNQLVVAVIGVSGALSYWAPFQPLLGSFSIALLLTGLYVRLAGSLACPAPPQHGW